MLRNRAAGSRPGTSFVAVSLIAGVIMASHTPAAGDARGFAKGSNAFGLDLHRRLPAQGNLVFSPASVSFALAMTWAGARGTTAAEMQKALRFEGGSGEVARAAGALSGELQDPARSVTFKIANRLFGEKSFALVPAFLALTRDSFKAPLEPTDFENAPEPARGRINAWVEEQTAKRIVDLVPSGGITRDTRLVLVNAIYFLGDWQSPFEKDSTRPAPFRLSAKDTKDVPTMHKSGLLRFGRGPGWKALELPYKGQQMSMLLLLPDAVDGLPAFEQSLSVDKLDGIVAGLAPTRVAVALPKFEVNPAGSLALADNLKAMGMVAAFDRKRADFTGIANPPDPADRLFIEQVFHKAFVKSDEKGTEAAAATAVVMPRAASMPMAPPEEWKADHPFLFLIRDNASGLVLFLGRVADPSVK